MAAAGSERVRVVVRPEKVDLVAHARTRGLDVVEGHPANVGESLALGLAGLAPDDIVLFGFPDTIWTPVDGFAALRDRVAAGAPLALGVFRSPDAARSDVVVLDESGFVVHVDVKPGDVATDLVWACAAARVRTLEGIDGWPEPGRFFADLAERLPIPGVVLGRVIDVGTPESLAAAEVDPVFESDVTHDDDGPLTSA